MTGALGGSAFPWLEPFSWPLTATALAATMALNTLVTGLIVFKILKVFLKVKRLLGSSAAGRHDYQHIAFIIIESGMALFATHLVRIVLTSMSLRPSVPNSFDIGFDFIIPVHQMINVIISSDYFYTFVY